MNVLDMLLLQPPLKKRQNIFTLSSKTPSFETVLESFMQNGKRSGSQPLSNVVGRSAIMTHKSSSFKNPGMSDETFLFNNGVTPKHNFLQKDQQFLKVVPKEDTSFRNIVKRLKFRSNELIKGEYKNKGKSVNTISSMDAKTDTEHFFESTIPAKEHKKRLLNRQEDDKQTAKVDGAIFLKNDSIAVMKSMTDLAHANKKEQMRVVFLQQNVNRTTVYKNLEQSRYTGSVDKATHLNQDVKSRLYKKIQERVHYDGSVHSTTPLRYQNLYRSSNPIGNNPRLQIQQDFPLKIDHEIDNGKLRGEPVANEVQKNFRDYEKIATTVLKQKTRIANSYPSNESRGSGENVIAESRELESIGRSSVIKRFDFEKVTHKEQKGAAVVSKFYFEVDQKSHTYNSQKIKTASIQLQQQAEGYQLRIPQNHTLAQLDISHANSQNRQKRSNVKKIDIEKSRLVRDVPKVDIQKSTLENEPHVHRKGVLRLITHQEVKSHRSLKSMNEIGEVQNDLLDRALPKRENEVSFETEFVGNMQETLFEQRLKAKGIHVFKLEDAHVQIRMQNTQLHIDFLSQSPLMMDGVQEYVEHVMQEHGFENYRIRLKDKRKDLLIESTNTNASHKARSMIDVKV